jgi:hypothetical protein
MSVPMPYWPMQTKLPHGDATYKTVQQTDMTFGVEVTISDGLPTTVAGFASEAQAERWIAKYKEGIALAESLRRSSDS